MHRLIGVCWLACWTLAAAELPVRITWGYQSKERASFSVRLAASSPRLEIRDVAGIELEGGDELRETAWHSTAGGDDVDGVRFLLRFEAPSAERLQNLHVIWADLISASDGDTARRLRLDPALRTNGAKLTVLLNAQGTRGFSIDVSQLERERAMWVPAYDVYVTAGDPPVGFDQHQQQLRTWKGRRVLDRVRSEPEATYAEYTAKWEDMGHPTYTNPKPNGPGHIICVTWDSAVPKFGIDRAAGVWSDYGNPDRFQFWFDFGDLTQGVVRTWKSQSLTDGLPVVRTVLERDGVRYEVEQFAYPLEGPPAERRGNIAMVLMQRVRLTDLTGQARTLPVTLNHRRRLPPYASTESVLERRGSQAVLRAGAHRQALIAVDGLTGEAEWSGTRDYQRDLTRIDVTAFVDLPANGTRELVVKLPSPVVPPGKIGVLESLDYVETRQATLKFWGDVVARGAQFRVPEKTVNDLFRASLWHALRLPRRHGGDGARLDLPYSNFAYSQTGTPWPVNQAVYVDYMLYDLRGYHGISAEEMEAQYRGNQEHDGHLNGVANWVSYTPGMMYAVAQQYLLTRDRKALDRLLPMTMKSAEWCLNELKRATNGLVDGPLNDGTGTGAWGFNQAYVYAGLERLGRVLDLAGHAKAGEVLAAARTLQQSVAEGFGAASARSPLVQLRDHTWIPYVPCDANTPRRLLEQWYPADVDTGSTHLIRLKAVPAGGELADFLLHDHEDNLYWKGLGIANEPVYNQQATAYLLRDDPKAVIRAFYSYMASGFSHTALEPVEHRWTHGQYFGPPSTDGAWFELYRNMLLREVDDATLLIGQAAPRRWLESGQAIEVERAPTYFGPVTFRIHSQAAGGQIRATVEFAGQERPATLLVRLRHPSSRPMRLVSVNGRPWSDFDAGKEWVRIPNPGGRVEVTASY